MDGRETGEAAGEVAEERPGAREAAGGWSTAGWPSSSSEPAPAADEPDGAVDPAPTGTTVTEPDPEDASLDDAERYGPALDDAALDDAALDDESDTVTVRVATGPATDDAYTAGTVTVPVAAGRNSTPVGDTGDTPTPPGGIGQVSDSVPATPAAPPAPAAPPPVAPHPPTGRPPYGGPPVAGRPPYGPPPFGSPGPVRGRPPYGPPPGAPFGGPPPGYAVPPYGAPGPRDAGARPGGRERPRPEAASAAELTEEAIVRFRSDRPQHGWRRLLFTASGGLLNPGIGPLERARQEQLRRIRRPLPGSHQIAVGSIKGGVGKTSVAACLGLVLAENRGDRVIALDANPDAGTLADRLTADTSVTVRSLLDNLEATHSLTEVARYTSLAGRLQVLASEQDPAMSEAFNRDEYERVCAVLTRFYNIVITDSGTGLVHSAMEGTLALADSLVVVGSPTVDGASRASKTLDWLVAHGHAARVANAVVVLSCDRVSKEVDRARVRGHFEARCRAVVEVPFDPHLATGGRIELGRLRRPTLDAFLALAALLADGFGGPVRAEKPAVDQVPSLS